ncbi:MAG: N-formylglutamate amidohydrolase [Nanoarchaeota archaeon]
MIKDNFNKFIERISPILLKPTSNSITISLSKRFMLFKLVENISLRIENDLHLNFISLLKYYKVFGKILEGDIKEFYKDRNKRYFKDFFLDVKIWEQIKEDLEHVYLINNNINVTITKHGIIVYNNYKKNQFNILLLTIHSGTYIPNNVEKKMYLSSTNRKKEEDIDTNKLYSKLVLNQGGVWIDNKCSRFYCDLNRNISNCIYENKQNQNNNLNKIWKEDLTTKEINEIHSFYSSFYSLLTRLLDVFNFNIIFDAHSMRHEPKRPDFSLGTHFIPKFYLPIVKSIKKRIISLGYRKVGINRPYGGGFILKWLSSKYPFLFIFSMEINKKIYMSKNRLRTYKTKTEKISNDLVKIFDIVEEKGFRINKN